MTILDKAKELVYGNRREDYGHPLDDYTRTAMIFSAILLDKLKPGEIVTAEEAALCMEGVKISRECHASKEDNRVDGAGYWEVLDLIVTERLRRGLPDPAELPDSI